MLSKEKRTEVEISTAYGEAGILATLAIGIYAVAVTFLIATYSAAELELKVALLLLGFGLLLPAVWVARLAGKERKKAIELKKKLLDNSQRLKLK